MSRLRHTNYGYSASIRRILPLALVPGFLLAAFVLFNQPERTDPELTGPIAAITEIASPIPTSTQRLMLPESKTPDIQGLSTSAPPTETTTAVATPAPGTPTPATLSSATQIPSPPTRTTPVPAFEPQPTLIPAATDTPSPRSPLTRIIIPSIGIDSTVETKSLGPDGVMQTPSGPDIVSWYDFSSLPAEDGNAVFAGHVDYAGYGPAVFWRLSELLPDDLIEVVNQNGVVVRYRVTSVQSFSAEDDATGVVAPTGNPVITLITCDGTFDQAKRAYDERLVVTGVRVD